MGLPTAQVKPAGAISTSGELLFRPDSRGMILSPLLPSFFILPLFLIFIFVSIHSPLLHPAVSEVEISCLILITCHMLCSFSSVSGGVGVVGYSRSGGL